ncbi:MAG: cytochrome c biogenesis protein CcsA, partial [Clostridia bacterium]|nr:cytochrome c biogenesis protein CcsA [Clostridia bacterium]
NTWWTWEPRLTSTLVLWFIYLAYFLIRGAVTESHRKAALSAVFGIIGFAIFPSFIFRFTCGNEITLLSLEPKAGGCIP